MIEDDTTNPIADQLFEAVKGPQESNVNVAQVVDTFLKSTGKNPQDEGLLAYLAITNFSDDLSLEQRGQLGKIMDLARENSPIFRGTVDRVQNLKQLIHEFFMPENTSSKSEEYLVEPVESELAMEVIILQVHRIAALKRRELAERKQVVVEAFVDPETNQPGIRMSIVKE
jgi:hypothetical protein